MRARMPLLFFMNVTKVLALVNSKVAVLRKMERLSSQYLVDTGMRPRFNSEGLGMSWDFTRSKMLGRSDLEYTSFESR